MRPEDTALAGGQNECPPQRDTEEQLICEALVCEIRDAKRWVAVIEAWQAILAVRRMASALREEHQHWAGDGAQRGS